MSPSTFPSSSKARSCRASGAKGQAARRWPPRGERPALFGERHLRSEAQVLVILRVDGDAIRFASTWPRSARPHPDRTRPAALGRRPRRGRDHPTGRHRQAHARCRAADMPTPCLRRHRRPRRGPPTGARGRAWSPVRRRTRRRWQRAAQAEGRRWGFPSRAGIDPPSADQARTRRGRRPSAQWRAW